MTAKQEFRIALLRLVAQEGVKAMLESVLECVEVDLADPCGGQVGLDAYSLVDPLGEFIEEHLL